MASFGRTASRPSSTILGVIPAVESVIRRGENPIPSGSVSKRVALTTLGRLSKGSPWPIMTMFRRSMEDDNPFNPATSNTCPTISPAVRLRSSPILAVRQNWQLTGHPTWLEMQNV